MSDQSPTPPIQDRSPDENSESSSISAITENKQGQLPAPDLLPVTAQPLWARSVTLMASLGIIAIVIFLVYIFVVFSRVNQWNTVTDSLANETLQVRISFPQNVGRDETSKLHVVVENTGQETFSNLRIGFTSNGIARFQNSEALFPELPAKAQRNATLEYTIDNASIIKDSDIQLTAHLYYITTTLPVTGTVPSTTAQMPQPVLFNQPIAISVNPDREYYLKAEDFWTNTSTKLPAVIISIISAIGAFVSINVQGGPAKVLQWLVRAPTTTEMKGVKEP